MRLLKREKGLLFLLTLGTFFIISASFLAVQLWSGKNSLRGAAVALEAPVIPPAISRNAMKARKDGFSDKADKKKLQHSGVLEKAVLSEDPELEATTKKEVVSPAGDISEVPVADAKVEAGFVEPLAVAETTAVVESLPEKTHEEVATAAGFVAPLQHVLPARLDKKIVKPAKLRKNRKVDKKADVIPTEIPPEWNWFSAPLEIKMAKGKVEIVRSQASVTADAHVSPAVTAIEVVATEFDSEKVPAILQVAVKSYVDRPFKNALNRMARIRVLRAERKDSVDSSAKAFSPAAVRLSEVLRSLCQKMPDSDRAVATDVLKTEEVADDFPVDLLVTDLHNDMVETAVSDSDKNDDEIHYAGSGSSYSNRIISLLKQRHL